MIKYYKFKMIELFQDETEDKYAYYPEGIISLINYDQLLHHNKVSFMWKSPIGVAYESLLDSSNMLIEECSQHEYKTISDDIDYVVNNNIQKLLNESLYNKNNKNNKAKLTIVKDPLESK
jgi:hypothetical protein